MDRHKYIGFLINEIENPKLSKTEIEVFSNSLLSYLCEYSETESFYDLAIDGGANINGYDLSRFKDRDRHINVATNNSNIFAIKYLLDRKAKINSVGYDNLTPLMSASIRNDESVVNLLISRGCDINYKHESKIALEFALMSNSSDVAIILINNGSDIEFYQSKKHAIQLAIENRMTDVAKHIINTREINIDWMDSRRRSIIFVACKHNNLEIVELLLSKGADFSIANSEGITPFMIAFKNRNKKISEKLIIGGARIRRYSTDSTESSISSKSSECCLIL